ncbi:MAG: hypothetical protein RI922_837 [Bacteroidota bacterium]|jgi:hypothetical protein
MATIKLALDTRRAKKDGTFPLVFKLTIKRTQSIIPTGFSLKAQDFNSKSNQVRNNIQINEIVLKLESEYKQRLLMYLYKSKGTEDCKTAKKFILKKQVGEYSIYEFWNETIRDMMAASRHGGALNYKQSLSTISGNNAHVDHPKTV